MSENDLFVVFGQVQRVYNLYDEGKHDEAKALISKVESMQSAFQSEYEIAMCRKFVAMCLVDIGGAFKDEEMVNRGITYFHEWIESYARDEELTGDLYNLANGYYGLMKFKSDTIYSDATDNEEHRLARHYYRRAIENLRTDDYASGLACEIWTNYGNVLDIAGRSIEAIDAYDMALRINPDMANALGNKGVAISYLAPIMVGHMHLFYLDAIRLLRKALEQPLVPDARIVFNNRLTYLNELFLHHGDMKPEEIESLEPASDFHRFLCEFSANHGLFLYPVTLLGEDNRKYYGDPMFISTMYAESVHTSKFVRYITFLNEIKQDYVLGRYMLVKSQYPSNDVDAVDEQVSLYYPLDYSFYSSYIQLMKAAIRQAIVVLDKIAFFIYDYCKLKKPTSNRVDFRNIWGGNDKMREDLDGFASPYLFALFGLARDVAKKGDWHTIYEYRDALTHRFLVVHDFQMSDVPNADIPRANLDEFLNNTILAFKIARAAITYLILFVEHQETAQNDRGSTILLKAPVVPVTDIFRYRPN